MTTATVPPSSSPAAGALAADPTARAGTTSRARWGARVLAAVAVAFLIFDATMKLIGHPEAVAGTVRLGYRAEVLTALGVVQLVSLVLYLLPRTSILGAVLLTGYLGGAVATHVRVGDPLLSHTLFPVFVAAALWGALWLRDRRVRALLPLRRDV